MPIVLFVGPACYLLIIFVFFAIADVLTGGANLCAKLRVLEIKIQNGINGVLDSEKLDVELATISEMVQSIGIDVNKDQTEDLGGVQL